MKQLRLRWGLVLIAGFLAELMVFAIVFPVLYVFGQRAFLASILIASAVMPFIFAVWVGKRIESHPHLIQERQVQVGQGRRLRIPDVPPAAHPARGAAGDQDR